MTIEKTTNNEIEIYKKAFREQQQGGTVGGFQPKDDSLLDLQAKSIKAQKTLINQDEMKLEQLEKDLAQMEMDGEFYEESGRINYAGSEDFDEVRKALTLYCKIQETI